MKLRKWLVSLQSSIGFSDQMTPVVILITMVLSFGLVIPTLGFYWDDWPIIYMLRAHVDLWQYYHSTRPLMAWPDLLYYAILGTNPVAWQVALLITRSAAVLCLWWCLGLVWPNAKRPIFIVALLFAVYPVFFQEPISLTYKNPFIIYFLYFISLGLMLTAFRNRRWHYILTFFALTIDILQMATLEYFWGLELVRPLLLWIIVSETPGTWKKRLTQVLLNWLPYALGLVGVALWRFVFLHLEHERNAPVLLFSLLKTPISAIVNLAQAMMRDVMHITISTWFQTVQPATINLASQASILSWGLVVCVSLLVGIFLRHSKQESKPEELPVLWARQAIIIGIFALVVGLLPVWVTGRQVTASTYSDRLAIPALFGASLFITGLLYALISKEWYRVLIAATLVGFSAGVHFRVANDYRWEWMEQKRFYWQLYWRAPALEQNTSLLSEGGLFEHVTKYSLSTAINVLYPTPGRTTNVPFWAFELDDIGMSTDELLRGADLQYKLATLSFSAPSSNSILISYNQEKAQCLRVLSTNDRYAPDLMPLTASVLAISNLDRIIPLPSETNIPDPRVFGSEPEHNWCYYFEKADLARQQGDWATVKDLGDQVISFGYTPNDLYEWILFIEGDLHTENWERAKSRTIEIYQSDHGFGDALCDAWSRSIKTASFSTSETEAISSINQEIGCNLP